MKPTFFVEFPECSINPVRRGFELLRMFESTPSRIGVTLAQYLGNKSYKVALSMSTLDDTTAQVVALLNSYNVGVIAWITLPWSKGYWSSLSTIDETMRVTDRVLSWKQKNNLLINGMGFDNELPIQVMQSVANFNPVAFYKNYKKHTVNAQMPQDFELFLERLELSIPVEFYTFPRGLGFFSGGLKSTGRTIEMLYSSALPKMPFLLRSWLLRLIYRPTSIPALGIVTGIDKYTPGVRLKAGAKTRHLSTMELAQDMTIFKDSAEMYIFAMNSFGTVLKTESAMKIAGL